MTTQKKCDTFRCNNPGTRYSNVAPGTALWVCETCLSISEADEVSPSHTYTDTPSLRAVVQEFAYRMEDTLKKNDYKGGWQGTAPLELLRLLKYEVAELEETLHKSSRHSVLKESTDVANIAMFIADNIYHLERRNGNMCGVRHEFQRIQNSHLCKKCKHFEEDNCHTK